MDRVDGYCFACGRPLVWRFAGGWCDACHVKVETCCDGAPQPAGPPPAGCAAGRPGGDRAAGGRDH